MLRCLSALVLLALGAGVAHAQVDPSRPYMESVTWGGSGCPASAPDGVSFGIDHRRRQFTMAFDDFVAEAGPGLPIASQRRNCQISVSVHHPAGPSTTRIYLNPVAQLDLDAGTRATIDTIVDLQGADDPLALAATTVDGPRTGNVGPRACVSYTTNFATPVSQVVSVDTSLRLTDASGVESIAYAVVDMLVRDQLDPLPSGPECIPLDLSALSPGAAVDANAVSVQSVTHGGTGCPQGSVASAFAADRQSFTFVFDAFVASSGPGVPTGEARRNCQINVNARFPAGTTSTVAVFDAAGFVQTPADVSGEQRVVGYVQGDVVDEAATTFTGPATSHYGTRYCMPITRTFAAPTVIALNFNDQVRLLGALGTPALITQDALDFELRADLVDDCIVLEPCADADADGLCDDVDACPDDPANDSDGDGLCAGDDLCPGSTPDAVTSLALYHWAETDGDGVFETKTLLVPATSPYTMAQTGGCTCGQIGAALGVPPLLTKNGCSPVTMLLWSTYVAHH